MTGFDGRRLRVVVAVVLGSLLVGGGLMLSARLDAVIGQRVRVGVETTGRVVHVERYQIGRSTSVTRVTVDYALNGARHRELLSSELDEVRYRNGDAVRLHVDRTDATKAATAEGYATEDLLLQLPAFLEAAGIIMIMLALARLRRRGRGPSPDSG
ncbi:DUF3592 domain-containing protein [Micromonospora sp. DT47]|uniref:DUF3592 domain-containing protein n=1 Tax=Micromonospora sp. DT47 TaxID=3393431 RepID=UPI003CFA32A3